MEVFEAIQKRRSVRAYKNDPVPMEKIMQICEAMRLAPSWKDKQCWNAILLSDRNDIRQLGVLLRGNPGTEVFETAPCFLIVVADPSRSGVRDEKPYYMTDAAIALENGILAATELGLGTCWIGAFTEAPIKQFLGIPDDLRIVAITPLGIPAEAPDPRPRRDMNETVFSGRWGTILP